jgi:hypothetical protein
MGIFASYWWRSGGFTLTPVGPENSSPQATGR